MVWRPPLNFDWENTDDLTTDVHDTVLSTNVEDEDRTGEHRTHRDRVFVVVTSLVRHFRNESVPKE